ncbi:metallophosphoesterase family protein [Pseudoroseicyclus aestuarii]|uniref:3',5'-cyclic AMP phosphodiesterase CpdA n=1 Tax=Pseudoroseicyclus aestuarii TaxID=1795041 RepID=A0A318T7S6_9RHOB|nr:metallophosphoesterase [Pseudoroseicyclus aestuarii]PYE84448.1 3',5'-cyclic AMP phosphodiesterase CpdA [Pseudoroseicyclus aestuarii]
MRRILHISDLHFGKTRPDLLDPLVDLTNDLAPDLVAFSGDLTQRAREHQFEEARAFIDRLEPPVLVTPGNHDTPLDNIWLRFAKPFGRYKRIISRNLEPEWHDEAVSVVSVNTVNRFSWQRGRISRHTRDRVCRAFQGRDDGRIHVVMMHHPLEHGPEVEKRLMRGARSAVAELGDCGADVVLSGHLHNAAVAPLTAEPRVLLVQAGTGLSTRVRDEPNSVNLLHVEQGRIRVERYVAGESPRFDLAETVRFEKDAEGWREAG